VYSIDKPLTILLVEDDTFECAAYTDYISTLDDVLLVGVTNNAHKAVELALDNLPDAVILDLELHKGSGSGIAFLSTLKKEHPHISPYIMVITHNVSHITHCQVRDLGADFVMLKSQEGYNAKDVVEHIRSLSVILRDLKNAEQQRALLAELSIEEKDNNLKQRVSTEVDQIGISPKLVGRGYIVDSIIRLLDGQQNFIPAIAKEHNKTEASVERAMQNAINMAWNTMNTEDLERLYTSRIKSEKGVPTLSEFVWHYANKLKSK